MKARVTTIDHCSKDHKPRHLSVSESNSIQMVRKLKGKPSKETHQEKRQRKKENLEAKQKIATVVFPVLVGLLILLVLIFYWVSKK